MATIGVPGASANPVRPLLDYTVTYTYDFLASDISGQSNKGNARVKWSREVADDHEFQEVALNHGGREDPLLNRRAKSGGTRFGAANPQVANNDPGGFAGNGTHLPSIGQGQSNSYPNSTNGRGRQNNSYNIAGVSPPSSYPGASNNRSTSAGLSGRVDWKAKYLK